MNELKDMETMLEILSMAIVCLETEESFFRRSAQSSTSEVAKNLFSEIADDFTGYRKNLDERKSRILDAVDTLKANNKNRK